MPKWKARMAAREKLFELWMLYCTKVIAFISVRDYKILYPALRPQMPSVFVHINNPELAGVMEHAFSAST